ncbi:MAG TPA: hypothetical protein VG711_11350 [Phycisphaerales bacterium]|nr:hypothetical protein [Phycisphaerales bacterium]
MSDGTVRVARWMTAASLIVSIALGAISEHSHAQNATTQPSATMPATTSDASAPELSGIAKIKADAKALEGTVKTELAKEFLAAAQGVPSITPRIIYRDKATRAWMTAEEAEKLSDAQRSQLDELQVDDDVFYNSKYGTPLAYVRVMERLGEAGLKSMKGMRVLDFGCGGVGPLRMMALCGADVTGVDVDPFLRAAYSLPDDTGEVHNAEGKAVGRTALVLGKFPSDEKIAEQVGDGYDVIISKNTLKRGYVHPEREADPQMLIDLGVNDMEFVNELYKRLNPGGLLIIYNMSPHLSKADEPYVPWSDGRCAFERAVLEKAGFEVLTYDSTQDEEPMRKMGHILGWDEGGMKLESDLFCHYTVARRK